MVVRGGGVGGFAMMVGGKEQTYPVILELDNADSQVGNLSTLVFGFWSLRVDPSILGGRVFPKP